jgi:8-oxo-dGTP pyrophosphatase MutT (NUDIX family)
MAQKYKVYFANRPIVFTDMDTEPHATFGLEVIVSHGKSDTAWIENAISRGAKAVHVRCQDVDLSWKNFEEQFMPVAAAGGVVINDRNEVLFIYRLDKWDLPKGKIEEGEAQDTAALREVEEECSIMPLELGALLMSTYHTYILHNQPILKSTAWYVMRYNGSTTPQPQLEEGITDVRWIASDKWDLVRSNTYPSVVDVLDALEHQRIV